MPPLCCLKAAILISSTQRVNNTGEPMPPWRTPRPILNSSVSIPFTRTCDLLLLYMGFKRDIVFVCIPWASRVVNNDSRSTLPNAAEKYSEKHEKRLPEFLLLYFLPTESLLVYFYELPDDKYLIHKTRFGSESSLIFSCVLFTCIPNHFFK